MWPPISRNVIFPLHERLMHRPTFALLREIEASQWQSREQVSDLQARKLGQLLQTAWEHSPWHRQRMETAGISPRQEIDLETFRRLPTMDKADARENVDRILWREVPGGAFRYNTGGSSGEPLIFYFGRSRQAADAACRMRARRWWGVDVGDREVYLWGSPVELSRTDRIKTLRDRLMNQLVLNAFEMSLDAMDRYIDAIRDWRPRCIYGYASSLSLLAARARETGRDLRMKDLRVVSTTGEALYPHQRQLLTEVFGVPVSNEYGSRDAGLIALETPEEQLAINSETILLEVLDANGQAVADGQIGEACITHLCSEAQPFLRYRTGDVVRRSTESDRAGRGLEILGEVQGRKTDFVVRADGTVMHALAVIYVLRDIHGVGSFKLIQHQAREIEVLVVPADGWGETARAAVRSGLTQRLGELHLEIKEVSEIPVEGSGKHRYVVSHVTLPGDLDGAMRE